MPRSDSTRRRCDDHQPRTRSQQAETNSLLLDDYGGEDEGAWVLLEAAPAAEEAPEEAAPAAEEAAPAAE